MSITVLLVMLLSWLIIFANKNKNKITYHISRTMCDYQYINLPEKKK